jgi:hypothetical protein
MEESSASRFIESNGREERCLGGDGRPLEGTVVSGDGYILRFFNGFLDGVIKTSKGGFASLPAVESHGHLEWWRSGRLHRDNGLPAVITENFTRCEWWVNGKRVR